jgi:hypothetical protein
MRSPHSCALPEVVVRLTVYSSATCCSNPREYSVTLQRCGVNKQITSGEILPWKPADFAGFLTGIP